MNISDLGWNAYFQKEFELMSGAQDFLPARIVTQYKQQYDVLCEIGELSAEVSGLFLFKAETAADFPTTGDWVIVSTIPDEEKAFIHTILPRKTSIVRKAAGSTTDEQVLVSNVDIVFIVAGLDREFNLSRIERYLVLCADSGAKTVILLNKSDICTNIQEITEQIKSIAGETPTHFVSAIADPDFQAIRQYIQNGVTVAVIGSSGVGKSTIINRLTGTDSLKTTEISKAVGKGLHTTVRRELVILSDGGILIDTPGLREIQLWSDEIQLQSTFSDIEEIAEQCRFRNCRHINEPGCAVLKALEEGHIDSRRLRNYSKMNQEIQNLQNRKEQKSKLNSKARFKDISLYSRRIKKARGSE